MAAIKGKRQPSAENRKANQARFLDGLASGASTVDAAKSCGTTLRTLYRQKQADAEFSKAWDECYRVGGEALEQEAIRRATRGVEKTIFHKGVPIAVEINYSDTLLIFLMKARNPRKYCERTRANAIEREDAEANGETRDVQRAGEAVIELLDALAMQKADMAKKAA